MQISASTLLTAQQAPGRPAQAASAASRPRFEPSSFADALDEAAPAVPAIEPAQSPRNAPPAQASLGSILDIKV